MVESTHAVLLLVLHMLKRFIDSGRIVCSRYRRSEKFLKGMLYKIIKTWVNINSIAYIWYTKCATRYSLVTPQPMKSLRIHNDQMGFAKQS